METYFLNVYVSSIKRYCGTLRVQKFPLTTILCLQWKSLYIYLEWCSLYWNDTLMSNTITGDPLHSRALAHSRAPLFTQPCSHCSHSRAPGEQWARLCVFTLHGCVQAARLCRGSPVTMVPYNAIFMCILYNLYVFVCICIHSRCWFVQ